jgi:hypothetical protein
MPFAIRLLLSFSSTSNSVLLIVMERPSCP